MIQYHFSKFYIYIHLYIDIHIYIFIFIHLFIYKRKVLAGYLENIGTWWPQYFRKCLTTPTYSLSMVLLYDLWCLALGHTVLGFWTGLDKDRNILNNVFSLLNTYIYAYTCFLYIYKNAYIYIDIFIIFFYISTIYCIYLYLYISLCTYIKKICEINSLRKLLSKTVCRNLHLILINISLYISYTYYIYIKVSFLCCSSHRKNL